MFKVLAGNRLKSFDFAAKVLVVLVVFSVGVLEVYSVKGLYADGSYFLFNLMVDKTYWNVDEPRKFAQILMQTPVVLAMDVGEIDIRNLIYIHSAGLISAVVCFWISALVIQFRSSFFWVLLVAFSVTYLSSGFFSIGEYNVAYAMVAYCFSVMFRKDVGFLGLFLYLVAAVVLVRSYEAMVFLGPLLLAWCLFNLRCLVWRPISLEVIVLSIGAFLFLVSSAIAVWSILHPRNPANLVGAGYVMWVVKTWHFLLVSSMVTLFFVVCVSPAKFKRYILIASVVVGAAFLLNMRYWNPPSMYYAFRAMSGVLLFIVLAVFFLGHSLICRLRSVEGGANGNLSWHVSIVSLVLFLVLCAPTIVYTYQFSVWVKGFERHCIEQMEWVPVNKIAMLEEDDGNRMFNWAWANPSLCVVLRGDLKGGLLNSDAYKGWQPFDPKSFTKNPLLPFVKIATLSILGANNSRE